MTINISLQFWECVVDNSMQVYVPFPIPLWRMLHIIIYKTQISSISLLGLTTLRPFPVLNSSVVLGFLTKDRAVYMVVFYKGCL